MHSYSSLYINKINYIFFNLGVDNLAKRSNINFTNRNRLGNNCRRDQGRIGRKRPKGESVSKSR